jgi:hypothetical protein
VQSSANMGQGFTKSQHISYYTIWSIFEVGLVINLVAIPPRSSPLGFLFPHLTFCLVNMFVAKQGLKMTVFN